jgi:hypothetical protein
MTPRTHVLITGTGRAGTSFLVELLTHLGLDTGYSADSVEQMKSQIGRAGLEHNIRRANCPYIVKSPWFCDYAADVLQRDDILIEHIFVPIRDLAGAAQSRRLVVQQGLSSLSWTERLKHLFKKRSFEGGLWHTSSEKSGNQEDVLLNQLYKLMLAISDSEVPITLIRYPRLTKDSAYLYGKLRPVLGDIGPESFAQTFHKVARPELVHSFNDNDR